MTLDSPGKFHNLRHRLQDGARLANCAGKVLRGSRSFQPRRPYKSRETFTQTSSSSLRSLIVRNKQGLSQCLSRDNSSASLGPSSRC